MTINRPGVATVTMPALEGTTDDSPASGPGTVRRARHRKRGRPPRSAPGHDRNGAAFNIQVNTGMKETERCESFRFSLCESTTAPFDALYS